MAYAIIITLIIVFGFTLTGFGVRLTRGQQRIERRQAAHAAAIRASLGVSPVLLIPEQPHPEHEGPVLKLLQGGAASLLALLAWSRRHWIRAAVTGVGLAAAAALILALVFDRGTPAGPPIGRRTPSAGVTIDPGPVPSSSPTAPVSSRAPTSLPSTAAPSSAGVTSGSGSAPGPVVSSAGASSAPPGPPPTSPVPSRSPSPPTPSPSPSPTGRVPCLVRVQVPHVLTLCAL